MSLDNVKNILLILSGKGGVGKSSITTQLALSLSLSGHSVGILDIDLTGPSIPRLLGIELAKVTQAPGGWLPVKVHDSQVLSPAPPPTYPLELQPTDSSSDAPHYSANSTSHGAAHSPHTHTSTATPVGSLHVMSLAFLLASRSTAIVWRGPKKTAMVRQFLSDVLWPSIDYLLIDTPPGTSDEHISVVETLLKLVPSNTVSSHQYPNLAGSVIVTTPQAVAISDVKKEINFCRKTGVKVLGVVENMSGYVCPCCGVPANIFSKGGGQVMAAEFEIPFLGNVPLDGLWGQLVEEGIRPVYGRVVDGGDAKHEDDVGTAAPTQDEDGETIPREQDGLAINGSVDETVIKREDKTPDPEPEPVKKTSDEEHRDGDGEGEDDDDDDDGYNDRESQRKSREAGLLIDKYRSCSLYPVFGDISRKVVEAVESSGGGGVTITAAT